MAAANSATTSTSIRPLATNWIRFFQPVEEREPPIRRADINTSTLLTTRRGTPPYRCPRCSPAVFLVR